MMLRCCTMLLVALPRHAIAFSVLDIEGGSLASTLGVGGGSELYIVGTDLGDPFNAPMVFIGNNPNPNMTPCRVESFTSHASRFHCTIGNTALPMQHPDSAFGAAHEKLLTLHVIVDGREAMCDNGRHIGGTGIGDCRLRFDVGATPRLTAVHTPTLTGGELLRVQVLSLEELGAEYAGNVSVRLRRGARYAACPMLDESDQAVYEADMTGLTANTRLIGCRLQTDALAAAGFWEVDVRSQEANRGYALVPPASRKIDLASNALYDVETTPRLSSVAPSAISASGGARLTIRGEGFGGVLEDLEVSAAGVACVPTAVTDGSSIECTMGAREDSPDLISLGDRGVRYEWWASDPASSADTSTLAALRSLATFPAAADGVLLVPDLAAPASGCWAAACAGARLSGWFTAPRSGGYTFLVHADAEAELRWSSNASVALATTLLAAVPPASAAAFSSTWANPADSADARVSARVDLVSGERYWLQLTCAAAPTACAVGARVHTANIPVALAFASRPLTPRQPTTSCAALDHANCCAHYEDASGACFPAAAASTFSDGASTCASSAWLQTHLQDATAFSPCPVAATDAAEPSPPTREQLPLDMGCNAVTDRVRCCSAVDGRGGLYDQSPCVPAVGAFHTGATCEPASWVSANDLQAAASCEELNTARLSYGAASHHVQRVDIDLGACAAADAAACAAGTLDLSSANASAAPAAPSASAASSGALGLRVSLPLATSAPEASALLSASVARGVLVHKNTSADGQRLTFHLTYLSGGHVDDELAVAVSVAGASSSLPSVASSTIVSGGVDVFPLVGSHLNAPSAVPAVSVRVRGQTSALCATPLWDALRVGCFPTASLGVATSATFTGALSYERCAHHCAAYARFAVTATDECQCLSSVALDDEVPDGHCSASCSGSAAELCGGFTTTVSEVDGEEVANATASVFRPPPAASSAAASAACALAFLGTDTAPRVDSISPADAASDAVVVFGGSWPQVTSAVASAAPRVVLCGVPCAVLAYNSTSIAARVPACPAEPSAALVGIGPFGFALGSLGLSFRGALVLASAAVVAAGLDETPPTAQAAALLPQSALLLNGSAAGGTLLLLHGNGFPTSTAAVSVELVEAGTSFASCPVLWTSASALLCRTAAATDPAAAAGRSASVRVSITDSGAGETPAAATLSQSFTFLADADAASIASVAPSAGSDAGGLAVCVSGTRLLYGATPPTLTLGGAPCSLLSASDTELCCTTSARAAGTAAVLVHDATRGLARAAGVVAFTYQAAPTVTSLSPASGHAGTVVALSGSGLTSSALISLGGAACTLGSATGLTATCTAADSAAGAAALAVLVPGVGLAQIAEAAANFTFVVGFSGIEPAAVSAGGGAAVVLRGGGFTTLPPPVTVRLGASRTCAITSLSATQIECTAPPLFGTHLNETALEAWSVAEEALNVSLLRPSASFCVLLLPAASCCFLLCPAASCCFLLLLLLPPSPFCILLIPPDSS